MVGQEPSALKLLDAVTQLRAELAGEPVDLDRALSSSLFADLETSAGLESLSVAEVLRVRIHKSMARTLPASSWRDRALRARVKREVRAMVDTYVASTGAGAVTTSAPYLDHDER